LQKNKVVALLHSHFSDIQLSDLVASKNFTDYWL